MWRFVILLGREILFTGPFPGSDRIKSMLLEMINTRLFLPRAPSLVLSASLWTLHTITVLNDSRFPPKRIFLVPPLYLLFPWLGMTLVVSSLPSCSGWTSNYSSFSPAKSSPTLYPAPPPRRQSLLCTPPLSYTVSVFHTGLFVFPSFPLD